MRASDRSVQFAGGTLGAQRHICAFFNSIDEEHRVLRSFIRDGLDRGQKGFHVIDPDLQQALYDRSPHNVIRLILNKEEPGDNDHNNRYNLSSNSSPNLS